MANVTIKGVKSLARKLRDMPGPVREASRKALADGAEQITEMMRSLVPVDSGDLKNSIGWTWGKAPKGAFAIATAKDISGNILTIFAGNAKAFYARWVEFGTRPHQQGGIRKGTHHPGTTAQPYFFPSYRANKRNVKNSVNRAIRKAIKQVAASGGASV